MAIYALRQASRRSWRIRQTQAVKVIHLAYRETIQTQALALIAKKAQASLALEGELVTGSSGPNSSSSTSVTLGSSTGGSSVMKASSPPVALLRVTLLGSSERLKSDFAKDTIRSSSAMLTKPPSTLPGPVLLPLPEPAPAQLIVQIAFTDAPTLLGSKGRRKRVPAGVGLLFPELMGA